VNEQYRFMLFAPLINAADGLNDLSSPISNQHGNSDLVGLP
jgi:hypothetical protein